ncbi:MAG: hypothetical protein ACOY0T_40220 [Myxococcota bacterium]
MVNQSLPAQSNPRRSGCAWLLLLLACACGKTAPDPPPPSARSELAAAPPGARGAHPAFASARPPVLEPPPQASPGLPGSEPDGESESDGTGADPETAPAPPKPDGVAL